MARQINYRWLALLLLIGAISAPGALSAATTAKPAIVLAAFGTSTNAFPNLQKSRRPGQSALPGYEVRWAFTSKRFGTR